METPPASASAQKPVSGWLERLEGLSAPSIGLGIALVAFGVYANSLRNGFANDDNLTVEQNLLIGSLRNTWRIFTTGYWQQWVGATSSYRPLFVFSLALNYSVGGLKPFGYHLVNVLLHCANCYLFFILAGKYGLGKKLAGLAALIFAVHPVHTEAVANVVGRMELMGTFFCGLIWLFWKRNPDRSVPGPKDLFGAAFFFPCALFSKENFILFPVGLFLAEWISRPVRPDFGKFPRMLAPYLAFVPGLAIYLIFRIASGEGFSKDVKFVSPIGEFNSFERAATMGSVSLQWYRVLVAGYPLKPTYDQFNLEFVKQPTVSSWIGFGLFALLLTLAAVSLRKKPLVTFSILFLFSQMALFNGILIPLYTLFGERWLYLPSVGVCLLLSEGLITLSTLPGARPGYPRLAVVLGLSLLVTYGAFTIRRNLDWKDNYSLFTRFIATDPNHPLGYIQVANFVMERKPDLARALLTRALTLSPGDTEALTRLAKINLLDDNLEEAGEQADAVIAVEPPNSPSPNTGLALVHLVKAGVLLRRGDRSNGARELETSIRFAPGGIEERLQVGNLLLQHKNNEEAVLVFTSITRTAPDLPQAYNNLGVALLRLGRAEEARRAFQTTLRLAPNHAQARRNLQSLEPPPNTTPRQATP